MLVLPHLPKQPILPKGNKEMFDIVLPLIGYSKDLTANSWDRKHRVGLLGRKRERKSERERERGRQTNRQTEKIVQRIPAGEKNFIHGNNECQRRASRARYKKKEVDK